MTSGKPVEPDVAAVLNNEDIAAFAGIAADDTGTATFRRLGLLHQWVTSELACPVGVGWKDVSVPRRPYPREFRDDVVRVARNRDDGVTIEAIATDFGVHPMMPHKWMRQADVDEGSKPGKSTSDSAELQELRRRNRLLEQENEVLRWAAAYLSQANLPEKALPAHD
jgi:transposase